MYVCRKVITLTEDLTKENEKKYHREEITKTCHMNFHI